MARQQLGAAPSRLTDGARHGDVLARMHVMNIRHPTYGGVGDGVADDTAAFAAVYAAAVALKKPIYLPAGTYRVTALPDFANNTEIVGDGRWATTIQYDGTGTLRVLTNKQFLTFTNLGFYLTGAGAKGLQLSNCFRCSFRSVLIRGSYQGDGAATYKGQVGIILDSNTGGTFFQDCDINNLGVGMRTSCIENEMLNCKFTVNYQSMHGVGGTANAGMYMTNVEFVGGDGLGSTDVHLLVDGSANSWSLVNVWFEKGDYGARIGVAGSGGPSQFAMTGCKVGARVVGLQINDCRQPHLNSVQFDLDQGGTMTELVINATYVAEGVAINLVTTLRGDFAFADFPPYWTVIRRGNVHAGSFDQYAMGSDATSVPNKGYVDFVAINRTPFERNYVHTLGSVTRATGLGVAENSVKLTRAITVQRFVPHCRTANASGDLTIQVLKNGSSTGMPLLTLTTANQVAGTRSDGSWSFADGDIITFNVTAIGTTPGAGLTIEMFGVGAG